MAKATDNSIFGAERRSITLSVILHVTALLLAAFGLPAILPNTPDPEPMVMTVELLPISEMTNVKPSDKPITEKKETKAPVVKKPEPKEPPKPTPKPEPKPEPKKEEVVEKKFDPDEGKEKPIKDEKPKEKPKPEEDAFKKMMADLEKEADKNVKDAKDDTATEENKTKSEAAYDETMPLSLSEKDAIRNKYTPCWSPPMGSKGVDNLLVVILVSYRPDGLLIESKIKPSMMGRYNSDPVFRAAADAALRATRNPTCNPLQNMDASKYGSWKEMELGFDPSAYF